jgi:hypothetical protein
MTVNERSIVVISHSEDELSALITAILRKQGTRVMHIVPGALGSSQISLQGDVFLIDGWPISGVLFRASPESIFSDEFEASDQSFCDAEIRAVWLAALNLDVILAVNKYDAMTWFEGLGWPIWRRRLIDAGIPVSKFLFGDTTLQTLRVWYPYTRQEGRPVPGDNTRRILGSALTVSTSIQNSLIIGKDIVAGRQAHSIQAAADLLADSGISIAEITTDVNDNILTVNTLPTISNVQIGNMVSHRVAEMFHAHLHSR